MDYRVPRMDELESRAWLSIVATAELLPTSLDAELRADAGLTHFEYMTLLSLVTAERAVRMTELAGATNSQLPRLSKVVTRLEGRGLVVREPCPGDARATNVAVTQEGRRTFILATGGHVAHVRRLVIDELTREELAVVAGALGRVLRNLDPEGRFIGGLVPVEDADADHSA